MRIPQELKALPNWIVWRLEDVPGRPDKAKVPYSVRGGHAKTNDPSTWSTFDAAEALVAAGSYGGVGFVFTGTPYTGIDLDWKAGQPPEKQPFGPVFANGALSAWAREAVEALDSYTERSQSGNGLHIIVKGKLPAGARRKGQVETYDATSPRYFAMTGDVGERANVREDDGRLAAFHARWLGSQEPQLAGEKVQPDDPRVAALVRKAKAASPGFAAMYNFGETRPGKSPSESDSWMARELARWERDPSVIHAAMQASALARPRWAERRPRSPTGTLIGLAIADALESVAPEGGLDLSGVEPAPAKDFAELSASPPPPVGWLVDEVWPAGARGWMAGEAKLGKSWLALEMAVAVATGTPFLDRGGRFRVNQARPVLYLTEESNERKLYERISGIVAGRGDRSVAMLGDRLKLTVQAGIRLTDPSWAARVIARVRQDRPGLVVVDPMRRYHRGDENDSSEVQPVLDAIAAIQAEGCAVVVVHHMRKASEANSATRLGQQMRGSSDLHAWGDAAIYVAGVRGSKQMACEIELKDEDAPAPFVVEPRFEKADLEAQRPFRVGFVLHLEESADDIRTREAADRVEALLRALPPGERRNVTTIRREVGGNAETVGDALARLERLGRAQTFPGRGREVLWGVPAADDAMNANETRQRPPL